ncbi:hypothetical protein Tco_1073802 [Tanacetum coccineum]
MWEAIKRLQQGESLNIQDVKTNLFWEFGQFTSHDGETIESYYTRFYKLMNEIIRNNLTVATIQVNAQFLQQLQPEWSRFVTIVKKQHKLDEVSYHKLFDILKQYQKEVNELCAERIAKNANPLALIATPTTPPFESASKEDSDPEQAQKDKEMQKNLALTNLPTTTLELPQTPETRMWILLQDTRMTISLDKQSDWLADTDEEIDEQELEAHYNYIAKIQEVPNADLGTDSEPLEQIQKQLNKANITLAHKLTECKSILAETSRTLEESNSIRDSCLVTLQNKQTELEKYKTFNDRTVDYDKLKHKLNETRGLLAQKDIDIKEGLKLKAYEILVVKEKHDELVKQSILTKSHYKGLVKDKTKRVNQIQTNHMLAPKCPTFNGRPTFANLMCLKKAQSEIPCLYEIPHDQSDPANRLITDREETLTLERETPDPGISNTVGTTHNPNEVRKKMWRKSFVKTKPNIFKNIDFLPVSKSISKSRQAYNVMTNNINHLRELVDQAWVKHSKDHFRPTAQDMEILIKTCLMPLALKTQNDSFAIVHELKQEMHADLKYAESFEDEIDALESDKVEFSNMYDMLLQECVSNDIMCSYLQSLSNLDEITELQCLYLHKFRECDCLAQKLFEQTEFVNKEIYTELLRSFAKLEKHSISLEIALQQCQ